MVGKPYAEIDRANVAAGEASFDDQGRARLGLRGPGRLRIYAEKASGVVVGAEMCAPDGEHLAHWLALAIERKCTVRELLRAPFYHPCLEEAVRSALRDVAKDGRGGASFELEKS
jgi:dihydrolipoamide dehydrogenase